MSAAFGAEFRVTATSESLAGLMHKIGGGRMPPACRCIDNLRQNPESERVEMPLAIRRFARGDSRCRWALPTGRRAKVVIEGLQ